MCSHPAYRLVGDVFIFSHIHLCHTISRAWREETQLFSKDVRGGKFAKIKGEKRHFSPPFSQMN